MYYIKFNVELNEIAYSGKRSNISLQTRDSVSKAIYKHRRNIAAAT